MIEEGSRKEMISPIRHGDALVFKSHKEPLLLVPTYSSRGSLMLRAALGENVQRNNILDRRRKKVKLEQVKLLKIKSKTPRLQVNFSEPLVSQKHEYEQVPLEEEKNAATKSNDELQQQPPQPPKRSIKRKRKIVEEEEIKSKSCDSHYEDDEGLFSSPKVAKIAPYYRDMGAKGQKQAEEIKDEIVTPAATIPNVTAIPDNETRTFSSLFNSFKPANFYHWISTFLTNSSSSN